MIKGYILYHPENRTVTKGHADDTGINLKTTLAFNTTKRKDATIFFDKEEAKKTAKLVKGTKVKEISFDDVPTDPEADANQTELPV